jgi:hypothetical protein
MTPDRKSITARQQVGTRFWLWSLLFHGALLVYLLCFSPVRVIDLQERKRDFTADSTKIRDVMDSMRDRQADLLQDRVRELLMLKEEMARIKAMREAEFQQFLKEFGPNAPSKAVEAQDAAAKAMAEALAAQDAAGKAIEAAKKFHTKDAWSAATAAQKKAQDAQMLADQSLDRALQLMNLGDPSLAETRKVQAEANELQTKADKAQLDASSARESTPWAQEEAARKEESVRRSEEALQQATAEADAATTSVESEKTLAAEAGVQADTAKTENDAAQTAVNQPGLSKEEKKVVRTAANKAKEVASQTSRKANEAQNKVAQAERRLEQAKARTEQAEKKLAQNDAEASAANDKAATAETQATETQAQARQQQAKALAALTQAQSSLVAAMQNAPAGTDNSPDSIPTIETPLPDVSQMDLATIYQTAVGTEAALTESYRDVRAAELAMIRQVPLAQAKKLTEVARTVRPDLTKNLAEEVTSGQAVPEARAAVQSAINEINSMVALGQSMVTLAKGLGGADDTNGISLSMDLVNAKSAQDALMTELAAEDANERAKDLSAAMQGNAGEGAGNGAGAGAAGRPGARAGRPGGIGAGAGMGFGFRPGGPPGMPKELRALPSRKINRLGNPTQWVFVDSWYLLGPFDNAGRASIEKKFPPETVVDLDATYAGKENQSIRWEFCQSGAARITPAFPNIRPERRNYTDSGKDMTARGLEYIIYYAYTELHFETPQDLWIAVGSDDYSKLWIEDQLVWASGKEQKSWRADEGYRKVHFKAGVNRILFRVENGWHGTDFSLCICLKQG